MMAVSGWGPNGQRKALLDAEYCFRSNKVSSTIAKLLGNWFRHMPYKVQDIYASFVDKNAYNGVGLKNVYQRLKIYFGDKADVRIDSELDEGTTVTLKIPVKERKINEE